MADKHSLNYDVRELKLGASFTNNKASSYHTIKYDFKPASVDVNKMATVDVGTNNQVTVTVPHLDGAGVPQTVFKGSQRPYTKECVLIIDRVTGEITLEKLSSNIQVKKTRQESLAKPRPLTPVTSELTNTTQRSTSRTRVATNRRTHAPAPLAGQPGGGAAGGRYGAPTQKTPPNMVRSPTRVKTSPPQAAPWSGGGNSTLASLPMLEDLSGPSPAAAPAPASAHNGYAARPYDRTDHRAPEHRASEIRAQEHRASEIRAQEHRASEIRAQEHRASEIRAQEHRASEIRAQEHRASEIRAQEHRALEMRAQEHRNSEIRGHEHKASEIRSHEHRGLEHRPQNPKINVQAGQDDSSSSSSSDSDSDSGSDSDDGPSKPTHHPPPHANGGLPQLPSDVLNDDLCLSDSGSDSD